MAILDELLVRLGIDASELTGGTEGAADQVENSLAGVGDAGRQAGQEAARGVQAVADGLDEVGASAEQAADGAQAAADGAEQSLRGVAAAAAGAAAGAAFMSALTGALDATSANVKLKNQLDLTAAESGRAGDVAGSVFSAGFGESIGTVNDALGGVVQNVGAMGETSNAELQQMTKAALGLANTFEFDLNEATQAAGTLMKSGLAKDGTQAFDLLTAAAQKLPPLMRDELPSIATEYTEFFDQLGFTGPQMMGLFAEAAKNPTFQLDKLGDAVKEFSLLIADTEKVSEPLKDLGLDVEEIQKLVNTGRGTEAFDQVTSALRGVENQTERTALQAALFGGPGEDLGNSLLQIDATSAAAKNGLADVAGASKNATDAMEASPAQQLDSIMRTLSATLGEALGPALSAVAGFAADHPGLFKGIALAVAFLAAALAVGAVAQWAMNSAMLANPVMWIVIAIVALIAIIVIIATKTTWFQDLWSGMTSGIAAAWSWLTGLLSAGFSWLMGAISAAFGWVLGIVTGAWDGIKDGTGAAWDWVVVKINQGIDFVLDLIGGLAALPGIVGGFFSRMASKAADKIGDMVGFVKSIPGRAKAAVGNLGSLLWNAGKDIVQGLINGVSNMIGSLRSKFSSITSMIPDWKGPMDVDMRLLEPSGQAIMGGLMDGIDTGQGALHRQLAQVTSSIPANVQTGVRTAAASTGGRDTLVLEVEGGDEEWTDLVRRIVRLKGGGSVEDTFGDGTGG